MPIALFLQTLVTLALAIHIYRTGRPYWWIFVILMFPLLGAAAYLLLEVLPNAGAHRQVATGLRALRRHIDPTADFRARVDEMERCGSVDNRIALARECLALGHHDQAVQLLQSCATAQFADDLEIKYLLAQALFGAEKFGQGREVAAQVVAGQDWYASGEAKLLLANACAASGDRDAANGLFADIVGRFTGEEARADYIEFLIAGGRYDEARTQLDVMRKKVRLNGSGYRRLQRAWIDAAERAVRTIGNE